MKKPKEAKKDLDEVLDELNLNNSPVKTSVLPLTHEFGREDLNLLKDKINEIAARI